MSRRNRAIEAESSTLDAPGQAPSSTDWGPDELGASRRKAMSEMTCREFDEIVHGYVRMELLDVSMREAALEHAAHCEPCSERMADAAALAEASERMGKGAREAEAPPRLEKWLLAAY